MAHNGTGPIDLIALQECTERIREQIEKLEFGDDEGDGVQRLDRSVRRPTADRGSMSLAKSDLFRLGLTTGFHQEKRRSLQSLDGVSDESEEESESNHTSDSDFLQFYPDELKHVDDSFHLGNAKAQVTELIDKFSVDERAELTQHVADWFLAASASSQGVQDELDRQERSCVQEEEDMDQALRDLGNLLQLRDMQTIQHMKRFYHRIQDLRPGNKESRSPKASAPILSDASPASLQRMVDELRADPGGQEPAASAETQATASAVSPAPGTVAAEAAAPTPAAAAGASKPMGAAPTSAAAQGRKASKAKQSLGH